MCSIESKAYSYVSRTIWLVLLTRLAASMSNSRTSNINKKSPTHWLTINHIAVLVPKIFIEWVIALYGIKNCNDIDLIIKPILAVRQLLDKIKYSQRNKPKRLWKRLKYLYIADRASMCEGVCVFWKIDKCRRQCLGRERKRHHCISISLNTLSIYDCILRLE